MKVIISQPRYLPITNYLQRMYQADLFVFLDDVQRQGRGVENRNKILYNGKPEWLTIPIRSGHREKICEAMVDGNKWVADHCNKIILAYKKHPYFSEDTVKFMYSGIGDDTCLFAEVVARFLQNLCCVFKFMPRLARASELNIDHDKTGPGHLYDICMAVGASRYISGQNGMHYGVEDVFSNKIAVRYNKIENNAYEQIGSRQFTPWLCFFDQLFNTGHDMMLKHITTPLVFVPPPRRITYRIYNINIFAVSIMEAA